MDVAAAYTCILTYVCTVQSVVHIICRGPIASHIRILCQYAVYAEYTSVSHTYITMVRIYHCSAHVQYTYVLCECMYEIPL